MLNYSINSIYRATEGEGVFIGTPQVFVRFQGCAVGCINCDSLETWEFVESNMNLESVVQKVLSESLNNIKRVSITGGDPLHPKNEKQVLELTKELKSLGYFINIEAAGTRCVDTVFDELDFVSFDFKTPSTGVKFNEKVFEKFITKYSDKSQIKAVIADQRDFNAYYELARKYKKESNNWVITPCYEPNEKFPLARFKDIIDINEKTGSLFRVIGQQHKWLHGPDKKNI
jgi:7-carboxy-7-deazaguanine synthase